MTSNLAVAHKKQDKKIGLLDCDIYGPSQHRLFGAINQQPYVTEKNKLIPIERLGCLLLVWVFW